MAAEGGSERGGHDFPNTIGLSAMAGVKEAFCERKPIIKGDFFAGGDGLTGNEPSLIFFLVENQFRIGGTGMIGETG